MRKMNKKQSNTLLKSLSSFRTKPKSRGSRQDLHIKTTHLQIEENEMEMKSKLTHDFLSEESIFSDSPIEVTRPSVAETLIETPLLDPETNPSLPFDEYEYALDIIKANSASRQKKTFKQRLSGLRSVVRISAPIRKGQPQSPKYERTDYVDEYVPSANERFQLHLQKEFLKEISDAQANYQVVQEEDMKVHELDGKPINSFFRSENGFRVIDLIRLKPKDWVKSSSHKTIEGTEKDSSYFNKYFVKNMKNLGLNTFTGSKFKAVVKSAQNVQTPAKAEKTGIHVDKLIAKIKSDTDFKQEIIQSSYPNQLFYKSLFGDITEETQQYFVEPEEEDGYATEEGVASDIASVHVQIVDDDFSSDSEEKEHPLQRDFYPGEYQEIERRVNELHKRGFSEGFKEPFVSVGARQLQKLNKLLDGTNPVLAPSQLSQLQHVLIDEDGAIRIRNPHLRHKSSPTGFSPNDLQSVVKYLFSSTAKEALLIDGITGKAMDDFTLMQ